MALSGEPSGARVIRNKGGRSYTAVELAALNRGERGWWLNARLRGRIESFGWESVTVLQLRAVFQNSREHLGRFVTSEPESLFTRSNRQSPDANDVVDSAQANPVPVQRNEHVGPGIRGSCSDPHGDLIGGSAESDHGLVAKTMLEQD
jgi:hypothetical protein